MLCHRLGTFAVGAFLLLAVPAWAQGVVSDRGALEKAMRCVHAAMTDPLLPVGVMPERLAKAALARCADEIEEASAAVAGSAPSAAKLDSARVVLRKELYEYALQVAGAAYAQYAPAAGALEDEESSFARVGVSQDPM